MADLFVSGRIVTALEAAAVAVGRLDAALAGNPLRRGNRSPSLISQAATGMGWCEMPQRARAMVSAM